MYHNRGQSRALGAAICGTAARMIVLGLGAACAAGLFGVICGMTLGLIEGSLWSCLVAWGLRAAGAGLAAGVLMGAISGIYHVEEARTEAEAAATRTASAGNTTFLPSRPAVALYRTSVRSRN